ncbi:MAG: RagB/SusD family nutrient uptake outer membrane protein [Flavobacteriaceae bacterium]|nr:RagB/SusD family nutrient uptake outer membrane protein [Flavobacteriaceae bacterium]
MKKYISVIAFLGLFLTSCSDYLDVNPDSSLNVDINSEEKIAELLTGAYPKASYFPFLEARTDNVQERKNGIHSRLNEAMFFWEDYDYEDLDTPLNYWNACYQGIAQANKALELLASYPKTARVKALYGEAFLLRAYLHFMLVNIWSEPYGTASANASLGIPYVTKPEKNALVNYDRGTVAEVYEKIEKDLKLGITLVNDKFYKKPKFHFNKKSAYAFASRFYSMKGEWNLVIEYANYVLGSNPKKTLRKWNNYFGIKSDLSERNLYKVYTDTEEPANLLLATTESRWKRNIITDKYGLTYNSLINIYRKQSIDGCGANGKNLNFWGYGTYLFVKSPNYITNGFYMSKFDELSLNNSISLKPRGLYVTNVLFSTDEVLLNRMEAYAMLQNYDQSISDLKDYMKGKFNVELPCGNSSYTSTSNENYKIFTPFYGLTVKQLALIKIITDFRQKEFLHEGLRWFDIRRFYMPVNRKAKYRNYQPLRKDDPRKLLQIPVEAIERGMTPNPR